MAARKASNLKHELTSAGPEFFNWPLGLAGLSDGTLADLEAQGVVTVGDFSRLSQARLIGALGSARAREAMQRLTAFVDWACGVAGVTDRRGTDSGDPDLALKWQWLSRQPLSRPVLRQLLADTPFPTRAQNAFVRLGLVTLDDLLSLPFAALRNTPNLGQVTLKRLVEVVEEVSAGSRASSALVEGSGAPVQARAFRPAPPRGRTIARQGTYSWFYVHEVADRVYAISEPLGLVAPSFGVWWVNSYLVVGSRLAVLIDTGMGVGDIVAVVREATWLPVLVVNTHCHWDHVGGNSGFPDIAAHRYERRRLEQEQDVATLRVTLAAAQRRSEVHPFLPARFAPRDYRIHPSAATRSIADRDRLDLGGRSLEVIHTPGHSPGSVCLFDRANHLLFTGDSLYAGTMWLQTDDADFCAFRESLARLSNLAMDINFILGGHNEAVSPTGLLWDAIQLSDSIAAGKAEGVRWGQDGAESGIVRYHGGRLSMLMRMGAW